MKTWLFVLLGGFFIVTGVGGAAYVGIVIFLIGGIKDIVDAAQASPVDGNGIAIGVVKLIFAETAAVLIAMAGVILGIFCFHIAND